MEAPVKTTSSSSVAIKMGLLYGAFCILTFVLFARFAQPDKSALSTLVNWASAVGIIIFAHITYKKNGDGFMSYGQGLGMAAIMGLVCAVIVGIGVFVYLTLDPTLIENIRGVVDQKMAEKNADDESAEMAEKFVGWFTSPGAIGFFTSVGVFFRLLIFGLIVSIFTKNESAPAPF